MTVLFHALQHKLQSILSLSVRIRMLENTQRVFISSFSPVVLSGSPGKAELPCEWAVLCHSSVIFLPHILSPGGGGMMMWRLPPLSFFFLAFLLIGLIFRNRCSLSSFFCQFQFPLDTSTLHALLIISFYATGTCSLRHCLHSYCKHS